MASLSYDAQWVTVVNRALARIGASQITSLDDGTPGANNGTQLLPQAIETVHTAFHWKDATKSVQLVPVADAPAYGYAYKYPLPEDFALLVRIDSDQAYEYQSKAILSDAIAMYVTYVALPSVPEDMSPLLRDLVVRQLAYLISIPMIKNDTISNRLLQEYTQLQEVAKTRETVAQYDDTERQMWYDEYR